MEAQACFLDMWEPMRFSYTVVTCENWKAALWMETCRLRGSMIIIRSPSYIRRI